MASICSSVTDVPSSALYFAGSKGSTRKGLMGSPSSTVPLTTSPQPSSTMSWQALSMAALALAGSRPFSKIPDASVLSPSLFADLRMFGPLKVAASNSTVFTSSVIMEFSPPMMPATPISFSASQIIRTLLSNFLVWPSRVTNSSPSLARLTIICPPAMVERS